MKKGRYVVAEIRNNLLTLVALKEEHCIGWCRNLGFEIWFL